MAVPNLRRPTGLRNRAMLELMYRSGLRVGEVCGLHLRDVRWSEKRIHLRSAIAKGGKEAWVSYDRRTEELLERWKVERAKHAAKREHLFTILAGGPVSTDYCRQMIKRYARRAGLTGRVHPHMLRHTFATELLQEGKNIRQVQELLRHSSIETTEIYTHIFEADLHREIRERD